MSDKKKEREFDTYQKAAIFVNKNAVVSAGAGSGKTTVLSERFLQLVQKGFNVDEILTLTFTKKATVEMSDRIYKVLKDKAPSQAANFYKANIKTLDSYCNSVAKIGAHLYGISPDFGQDDESVYNQVYEKALPFILEHRDNQAIKELVKTNDYSVIAEELFVNPILKNSTIAEPINFEACINNQTNEIVTQWNKSVSKIDDLFTQLVGAYNDFTGNRTSKFIMALQDAIENNELPGPVQLSIQDVQNSNSSNLEIYAKIVYSIAHIRQPSGAAFETLKSILTEMRTHCDVLISIANYVSGFYITQQVIPLLKEFQEIVNNIKRSSGVLTFHDISNMALCILRDYPEIRKLEKQKYKAIMIDEFQDNNSMQRDMLFLLAEKPERMDKGIPSVQELCEDKLFFVGDEKQSIYIFRGADVSVFRSLSNDFAEGNLEMTTNYRSHQSLIAAFNTIFGGIKFPAEKKDYGFKCPSVFYTENDANTCDIPNYEAIYHEVTLSKDAKAETEDKEKVKEIYKPHIHFALYDKTQPANFGDLIEEEAEAEWVAKKIKELQSQGKDFSDMAILLRGYALQPLYERTFLKHGIPYNTETITGFYSDGPVNDIMALLRICVYPEDSISYAQVLRSPFVNLSFAETMNILAQKKSPFEKTTENVLSGKSREIYKKMQDFFAEFSKKVLFQPITKSISQLWYDAGYRFETMWNHTVEMYTKIYDLLFELARQSDQDNLGISGFVDMVANYKAENSKLENMDIPLEQSFGVHILTIYKSKGLEYDTVFVCGTHKSSVRDSNSSPVFSSKDFGITINTPPCKTFENISSQYFYDKVKEENTKKHSAELRRLVYVALTRAKKELYITNGKYKKTNNALEKFIPGGTGNVSTIFSVLEPVFNFFNTEELISNAPFSIEYIEPYARFETQENTIYRRNTSSDRKIFVNEINSKNPYEFAENSGKIIKKDILSSKYASPSKLHSADEETSPMTNPELVDRIIQFPEINEIVYGSIPKEEKSKQEQNPEYVAKPKFDFTDFGTIAHAYMEAEIKGEEVHIPNRNLVGLDNNKEKIKKISEICKKMAEKFKNSDLGKSAIGSTEFYSEYEFRSCVSDKIIKGIIDLVFKNPDGTYTIVDYKTNQEEYPEFYYNQLACYRQAISQMFGIKNANSIKCYLFYLRSGNSYDISEECSKVDLESAVEQLC